MKKLILLSTIFISLLTFAQVPQGISYQAIALNSTGNPVVSSNVAVRLSILDNSATGTVLYTETHTKTTNAQGLFNLVIGQGTLVSGAFNTINWGTNSKFLKVELDAAGGTNYVLVGTTQLLSVPYAMYAGAISNTSNNNITSMKNNNGNGAIVIYSDTEAKGYYLNPNGTNTGYWSSTNVTFTNPIKGAIASNNCIVVYSDTEAKGYYLNPNGTNTGYWSGTTVIFTNPIKGAIASNNCIVVYSDTEAKGYYLNPNGTNTGYWSGTNVTFTNTIKGGFASGGAIVIYSNNEAKGYYLNPNTTNTGYWSSTNVTFSNPIIGGIPSN
jgi:hypothetical protein